MSKFTTRSGSFACSCAAAVLAAGSASARPPELISVTPTGDPTNGAAPAISADGRYAVFISGGNNLVPGDTNAKKDVFRRDLQTGTTLRVSVGPGGVQGDNHSGETTGNNSVDESSWAPPGISADGRYIAFHSLASNLVSGDTNNAVDVFVHDTQTGVTVCASVNMSTGLPAGASAGTSTPISADGRYVAFNSISTLLVSGDTNGAPDVFVRDLVLNTTERVSLTNSGGQIPGPFTAGSRIAMSSDGNRIAFDSLKQVTASDTNTARDVYVRDRAAGTTIHASLDSSGGQWTGGTSGVAISGDGRYVGFSANDLNGSLNLFRRDLVTDSTLQVNLTTSGATLGSSPTLLAIPLSFSPDGRLAAFTVYVEIPSPLNPNHYKYAQVFLRDMGLGTTTFLSATASGEPGTGFSVTPSVSADGSVVCFHSDANNLSDWPGPYPAVYRTLNPCVTPTCVDVTFADMNPGSFLWSDTSNWSSAYTDNAPDNPVETAYFDRDGQYEVTIDEDFTCGGLTVRGGTPILRALDTTTLDIPYPECACNSFGMDISGPIVGPEPATLRLVQSESHEGYGFTLVGNLGVGDGAGWAGKLHLFGGVLEMAGDVVVGNYPGAQGFLTLSAGAKLQQSGLGSGNSGSFVVGRNDGHGEVSVSSSGLLTISTWVAAYGRDGAVFGVDGGTGLLNILDGGSFSTSNLVLGKTQGTTTEKFTWEGTVVIGDEGSTLQIAGGSGLLGSAPNACVIGADGDGYVAIYLGGKLDFYPSYQGVVAPLMIGVGTGYGLLELLGGAVTGSPPLRMAAQSGYDAGLLTLSATPTTFRSARVGIAGNAQIDVTYPDTILEVGDTDEGDGLAPCQLGVYGSGVILAADCSSVRLHGTEVGGFSGSFGKLSASASAAIFTGRCVVGGREVGATGEIEATAGGLVSTTELVLNAGATITGDRLTVTSIGSLTPPDAPCSGSRDTLTEGRIETAELSIVIDPFVGGAPTINVPIIEILPGASFGGTGPYDFNMENSAYVRPGGKDAVGQMTVNGTYTQTVEGTLEIDMDPFDPGAIFGPNDLLTASGTAVLGGTLRIIVAAGSEPNVLDQSFEVLSAQAVLGTFHHVEAVGPDAGYLCQATYSATGVSVVVTLAPPTDCPGDANGDGLVTFSDVSRVLANWGASYASGTGFGDANHDGVVNFADVTSVLANFGAPCS